MTEKIIYPGDVKLFESKVMTDESDGGGEMTAVEIVTGQHNTIFPDISDLDRTYGVDNIRSIHLKVDADSDATYYGCTVGLTETPVDPNVEITLMSVNNPYIQRDETRNIIERYLTKGAKYQGELLYTQLQGQRAIRFIQRTEIAVPVAGYVMTLVNKLSGEEQYIKIEEVSYENQTFSKQNDAGIFTRKVVTCIITEPLRYEFEGVQPNQYDPAANGSAVYDTMVANASKYYGLKILSADAMFNKSELKVDSIFTQLVPSTRVDSPHINQPAVNIISAKFDRGDGQDSELVTGVESFKIDVTIANQGYLYTATLVPVPTKGTTKISFMSQGTWYDLQDDGTGVLRGTNPAFGTGSIDEFGNLLVTCGALPDVDVPIIGQYQNINNYIKPMVNEDLKAENVFTITLGNQPINSESSTMTWGDGKTATIANGKITGDMTGEYTYEQTYRNTGYSGGNVMPTPPPAVYIYTLQGTFAEIPDSDTEFTITWDEQLTPVETAKKVSFSMVRNIQTGGILNLPASLPVGALKLELFYDCSDKTATNFKYTDTSPHSRNYPAFSRLRVVLLDNGSGQLIAQVAGLPVAGAINYATGVVTLSKISLPFEKKNWIVETVGKVGLTDTNRYAIRIQSTETVTVMQDDFITGEKVNCIGYELSTQPPAVEILAGSVTVGFNAQAPLQITVNTDTEILEESLVFSYNGRDYENRGKRDIYSIDRKVGEIILNTGAIQLNEWGKGNGVITLKQGVFKTGVLPETQYSIFRTAGSPVASQSLQVNAVNYDASNINAVTDADGNITSPSNDFVGHITNKTGVVEITASGSLDTESMRYNCVSYNYLPLDADLLGLDPIRLPSDGRVVIFEKGDVIAVHQDESFLQAVMAGQVVDLNEVRLARCETTASDAVIDLDAGTILFPTAGTFEIKYRFEDMVLLTYVDISGAMRTSKPLSHNYTAGKAKVSSLLIAGNLFARYTNLFDQKTWTSAFSDNLIGVESTAEYNDTLYPISVTDDGCITERFAIVFTSSTAFKLIGENVGQISAGDINNDFAPINPTSGKPYFTINKLGWGTGWSTNNVLRINFIGAVYQLNIIRTILQGNSINDVDAHKFALQARGSKNKVVI